MERKKYLPVIFIVIGMLIGAVAVSQLGWLPPTNAKNSAENVETTGAVEPPSVDTELINNLNSTFTNIATSANPSVVTIFSDRIVEQRRMRFPEDHPFREFFGDDFFGRFFSPETPEGKRRLRGMGSGVIMSQDGYVLTNHHVVREADKIQIMLHEGEKIDAKIVGTDAKTDLAVLETTEEADLNPIPVGNSDKLNVGEWVVAIGSPLSANLARTVTAGIVSAKGRSNVGLADYEDFIQTDAAINPGNSGGALINLKGELVGINTAIASRSGGFQGIGFAVPVNMATDIMNALVEEGEVVRGWLGIYIQDIDENIASAMNLSTTDGALVSSVKENGPADQAGIKPGDVIVAVEGEKMKEVTQLRNEIASRDPGSRITLKVLRDGQENDIEVELGQLPDEEATPAMKKSSFDKLGLTVETLTDQLAQRLGYDPSEEGVVITQISQASAAYGSGLRRGDVIKEVNKKPVSTASEFNQIIDKLQTGDTVLVYAKRDQNTFFAAFELE